MLFLLLLTSPARAWNGLGHKVVAEIAWQQLGAPTREKIVDTLRRHPRFDDDFAKKMPAVDDDAQWIFQQAAIWPDMVRSLRGDDAKYNHPTWHYVNFPTFIGSPRAVSFNLSQSYPTKLPSNKWNVIQAYRYCRSTIDGNGSPAAKAQAYCWLFHLVGDIHQPLHSTAIVCDRFPTGDHGGNLVKVRQGGNLHSLWDNLLGRQDRPADVAREVAELRTDRHLWDFDTRPGFVEWVNESRQVAKDTVYDPIILAAVEQPGDLAPINLPLSYLETAGSVARRRVVRAGIRLGLLLGGSATATLDAEPIRQRPVATYRAPQSFAPSSLAPGTATPAATLDHWLNTETNVRHNSGCRFYQKVKHGRACSGAEGKACGICGG